MRVFCILFSSMSYKLLTYVAFLGTSFLSNVILSKEHSSREFNIVQECGCCNEQIVVIASGKYHNLFTLCWISVSEEVTITNLVGIL